MPNPTFTICICPDAKLLKDHISGCILTSNSHPPQQKDISWKQFTYWADDELITDFWENISLQGLFSTHKAIILRNAHLLPAPIWKKLSYILSRPNEYTWLFLCLENEWEKNKPKIPAHITKLSCMAFAKKQGWIWSMNALNKSTVKQYLQQQAKILNLSFTTAALYQLSNNISLDAHTIENELQKLAILAEGKPVQENMLSIINYTPEFNIFNLIKCLESGNNTQIWTELKKNQNNSESLFFPFLGLLLREAKILWQIYTNEPVHLYPQVVQSKTLIVKKLGQSGIIYLFELIVQAELSIKTGKMQVEQCMEILISDLTVLFSHPK